MAGLSFSIEKLSLAERALQQQWNQTRTSWTDRVSQNFERDYWVPLETSSKVLLKEMEQLSQTLIVAERSTQFS